MFQKFFARLKEAVAVRFRKFIMNLPMRMSIGKFGIWMMKAGRVLQMRYANWNREFRLQVEYAPNPDYVTFNVSELVTDESILTFDSPKSQEKKRTKLIDDLFAVQGVCSVTLRSYCVSVIKARVFSWDELLPQIEKAILFHLTQKV